MKTPTHALVGYITAKTFGFGRTQTIACVLGAILPDLPLSLAYVYFLLSCFWLNGHFDAAYIQNLMDAIYFENSWLLVAHSMFHSPISIAYLALMTIICIGQEKIICQLILAFLVGSLSHSLLDILSHINDGPLLLWPLNDHIRLVGMFSHYFMGLPLMLEIISIIVLFTLWRKQQGKTS